MSPSCSRFQSRDAEPSRILKCRIVPVWSEAEGMWGNFLTQDRCWWGQGEAGHRASGRASTTYRWGSIPSTISGQIEAGRIRAPKMPAAMDGSPVRVSVSTETLLELGNLPW